jgi:hypothetical protein
MPVRTINYTNRRRIRREDARISIREERGDALFDANLHLADYDLPAEARVFVEAYRDTHYMRFDFGVVGALRNPDDRVLRDFDSAEGVKFRVKVVTAADPCGLLLAEADQIRPRRSTDEDANRISLLPARPSWDLGEEVWQIEFDDDETWILVNANLGNWMAMARDPAFMSLVYPGAFRTILWRILHLEGHRDTEDMDDWRSRWLCFAVNLPGVDNPPREQEEGRLDDWIDSAVSAFCRCHNIRTTYERYWTGAQEK